MTIWEQTLLNLQKGYEKFVAFAALFNERVRAELDITRLRIRADDVQGRTDRLHMLIGRRIVEMKRKGDLPKGAEQIFKEEDVAAAIKEIADRERELQDVQAEIKALMPESIGRLPAFPLPSVPGSHSLVR